MGDLSPLYKYLLLAPMQYNGTVTTLPCLDLEVRPGNLSSTELNPFTAATFCFIHSQLVPPTVQ